MDRNQSWMTSQGNNAQAQATAQNSSVDAAPLPEGFPVNDIAASVALTAIAAASHNGDSSRKQQASSSRSDTVVPNPVNPALPVTEAQLKKRKKVLLRAAGGIAWKDPSLLQWDEKDYRMFCGDLGNEVTDDLLAKAFAKYTSIQRVQVIRDKRTLRTKGYAFISFKDPDEFIAAMQEMNGRFVGNRPIRLRKSTWKDRLCDNQTFKEISKINATISKK